VYEAMYAGEGGFKPGDKVRHNVFGDGVVEKMSGDHVTVNFPGVGRKRLSVTFARLEKIG
jgi:DNA helicase-2/ATP-dependent DNA helicase PcrA